MIYAAFFKQVLTDKKSTTPSNREAENELNDHKDLYSDHRTKIAKDNGWAVLSMYYAENLMIPHKLEQPASFYFKTRRKVDIFGVNDELTNIQLNFLADECLLKKDLIASYPC